MRTRSLVVALAVVTACLGVHAQEKPLRLAIAGLVHGHVSGFLRAARGRSDVEIVGIYDPAAALHKKYAQSFTLSPHLFFTHLQTMLDRRVALARQ